MRPQALSPRDLWADAIWEDVKLTTNETLTALVFRMYAGRGIDRVFVEREELQRRSRLKRTASIAAVRGLERAGYLTMVEPARQHRSPRYALTTPPRVSANDTLGESRVSANDVRVSRNDARVSPHEPEPQEPQRTPTVTRAELVAQLARDGVAGGDLDRLLELARNQFKAHHPAAFLLKAHGRRGECIALLRQEQKDARQTVRDASARCADHLGQPAEACAPCRADVLAGDRQPAQVGKQIRSDEIQEVS